MPDFSHRSFGDEMMDDFSITDERLQRALQEIRAVNVLLGGHSTTMSVLLPFLRRRPKEESVRILDVGTGTADIPERIVRWAARVGRRVEVVATDKNAATLRYADAQLDRRLQARLRPVLRTETADALDLPYDEDSFDVAMSAMFMHHLTDEQAVQHLRELKRVARHGIIVNDLHRHPLAFYGVKLFSRVIGALEMFRHDSALSVLKSFTRRELETLASHAGLGEAKIAWHPLFRWRLSTLQTGTKHAL